MTWALCRYNDPSHHRPGNLHVCPLSYLPIQKLAETPAQLNSKFPLNTSKTNYKTTLTPPIYKTILLLHAEEILELLRPRSWCRSIDTTSTIVLRRCRTLDNQRVRASRNVKSINDTRTIFRRIHEVRAHGISSTPEITASNVAKIPKSLPRMGIHAPSCQDCVCARLERV